VYTAESYETLLRGKAVGVCGVVAMFSVVMVGIVGLPATKWLNGTGLYLIFSILSLAAFIAVKTIPKSKSVTIN